MTSSIKLETHKTYPIATPPEEDRATDVGGMHKKFGKDRTCSSGDMLADNQRLFAETS